MQNKLENLIKEYVKTYSENNDTETNWEEPLIAYANAEDPLFLEMKKVVHPNHSMPKDFLEGTQTVISYFIPFKEEIVRSNISGKLASRTWAKAYIETNKLIGDLNYYIYYILKNMGVDSAIIPANYNYSEKELLSQWSQRHVAFIAGLGKFGTNNMLITKKGCSGRFGSIVTTLKIQPTKRSEEEYCLHKYNGSCKKCISNCTTGALKVNSFDRNKCYEVCIVNANRYSDFGFCDVCGKCTVNIPCSFKNPVE